MALQVLKRMGVPPVPLAEAITQQLLSAPSDASDGLQLTTEAKAVLRPVYEEARHLNHNYIGTEHLLLALTGEDGTAGRVLHEFGITQERARREVQALQSGTV